MRVSVALAAYRGEAFLGQQLDSILPQLAQQDEIVISDDAPGGETQKLVEAYQTRDARIRYVAGPGKGAAAQNFAHALAQCTGDILFLCDQDDVWLPEKYAQVVQAIDAGADLVLHDARIVDAGLEEIAPSFFAKNGLRQGVIANLYKNSFIGCCMAFTRQVRDLALPMPADIPMHDWWIGLLALSRFQVKILQEPLLLYRRHALAVTGGQTSLWQKLRWRIRITYQLQQRLRRGR